MYNIPERICLQGMLHSSIIMIILYTVDSFILWIEGNLFFHGLAEILKQAFKIDSRIPFQSTKICIQ